MVKAFAFVFGVAAVVVLGSVTVHRSIVLTAASGRPLDHLGDRIRCLKCHANGVRAGAGYNYHCEHCGADYRARMNHTTHTAEIDW